MTGVSVRDLMTAPVMTVEADESLSEVAWAMTEKGIRSLAVIDADCRPVGILTSTDYLAAAADGADPETATVADYMTEGVETISPDAAVEGVAALLVDGGFNHVPVAEDGEVVGILSSTDLLEHVAGHGAQTGEATA